MKFVFDMDDEGARVDVAFGTNVGFIDFLITQLEHSDDYDKEDGIMRMMVDRLKEYKDRCKYKQSVWLMFSDKPIKSIEPLKRYIEREGLEKREFIDESEFGIDD